MSDLTKTMLDELARPFSLAAVRYKVLTKPGTDRKSHAAFYIDARLVAERLNSVVGPENWHDTYRLIAEENPAACAQWYFPCECTLTVLGCTKVDVGVYQRNSPDELTIKASYSDAFKRAAVKFRVGAFLYAIPKLRVEVNVGDDGKAKGFSNEGETKLKQAYERWLGNASLNHFGAPLEHGDVLDEANVLETA